MRHLPTLVLATAACGTGASDPARAPTSAATPAAPRATTTADDGPVVVELFTSQGCSSCPPADAVLSRLAREGSAGRAVAPLAFHVDYWNQLGWTDPWSRAAWSERQQAYASALGDRRVYTPALVIGGRAHVVGSNRGAVADGIAAAPAPAALDARLVWGDGAVEVTATAPADGDAWLAVYEDGLVTAVPRGENAGRTMTNDRVVRTLARIAPAGQTATTTVALDPSWRAVGAVAFASDGVGAIVASRELGRR